MRVDNQMLKLYNDDCMNILPNLEDESIDLIITSPPYNLGDNHQKPIDNHKEVIVKYNGYDDDLDYKDYEKWQITILNELHRILKPTGLLYYNHKERHKQGYYFNPINIIQQSKFKPLQTIIWKRKGGVCFNIGRFVNCYETINVAYKSTDYMKINLESEKYFDVWDIKQDAGYMIASFPLELPRRIIHSYAEYPNLTVLDCFMGGGDNSSCITIRKQRFHRN